MLILLLLEKLNYPTYSNPCLIKNIAQEFTLKPPKIIFSEWYAWDNIQNIPHNNLSGVYIIAKLKKKPQGPAQPNAQKLLYIGITTGKSQNIKKRLKMFFKAAQIGNKLYKHSGGNRFNGVIGNDLTNIYVASFVPIFKDDRFLNPFIFYAERKLIWEHALEWSALPICNGY